MNRIAGYAVYIKQYETPYAIYLSLAEAEWMAKQCRGYVVEVYRA